MSQQIEVPGAWDSIATLLAFVDGVEQSMPLSPDQAYVLRLVVEEIATNIVKYGYADGARDVIHVACSRAGDTLRISIRDRGQPFDPRAPAALAALADPAERAVGGLGLLFVRELADELSYYHDPTSGWNELVVAKGP